MKKPSKHVNSAKLGIGTYFGNEECMRVKLSDRDLILIAGIVVAVIILITTLAIDSTLPQAESNAELPSLIKYSKPLTAIRKFGNVILATFF